ncbi:MAG: hypothetical protein ACI8UX_000430 [Psychromonas sp.]|jgi:hypothetical protein
MAKYLLNNKPFPEHISRAEGHKNLKVIDAAYKVARTGRKALV